MVSVENNKSIPDSLFFYSHTKIDSYNGRGHKKRGGKTHYAGTEEIIN